MITVITLMALAGFVMLGAAIIGQPRRFHHKWRFVVEIDGWEAFAFRECSGLKRNTGVVEHWEGGRGIAYKERGRSTFDNINLVRGVTVNQEMYAWANQVNRNAADAGDNTPDYKKDLDIVQYDLDGSELRRWTVHQAFPVEFEAGSWDNTVDEVVTEMMSLAYDYFDQPGDNAPSA